ncbi:DUF4184 family protein [Curtobacterium herbarum]|uniref:DUF4184 family protein n=1 Tax=Curtobacterium herbarum TaxID=150122 RepID=A0ABN1Z8J8_9MICO|nr:DUF4184 family protein [Curtobacterium herbarum]MBM7476454.1 hypothetical protein [Curtobacterium herbarum]MCS6543981.1 DUF4184 family protein [Curtobacterium herbarum]
MPFTISHAVVALPFRRSALPVAAVAVGSMAPDAVLFAPVLPPYGFAHSWPGVVTVDLAVSLVVLAAWWFLVRPAWTPVLPARYRAQLPGWDRPERIPPTRIPQVVLACLLGSVTHVVWDACSHPDGWVVRHVPSLRSEVGGHPVSALVQDGSSVGGLLLLLVLLLRWARRAAAASDVAAVGRASRPDRAAVATVRSEREARTVPVAALAAVLLVALVTAGSVALDDGGVGTVVLREAFALPPTVAVTLVVGALVLLLVRRGRTTDARAQSESSAQADAQTDRSAQSESSAQTNRQERGEVRP